jgi:hypothetical protein
MDQIRRFVNVKVLIGGGLVTACLFGVLLVYLGSARQEQPVAASGTAVLYVIAAPSPTLLAPIVSLTSSPMPTRVTDNPVTSTIAVGTYVQITGTGGEGLRLRSEPGLSGTVRFLAIDGEVFQVMDGPIELDGYTWWLLQAPYDPNVQGWAVADFMIVVQNP